MATDKKIDYRITLYPCSKKDGYLDPIVITTEDEKKARAYFDTIVISDDLPEARLYKEIVNQETILLDIKD